MITLIDTTPITPKTFFASAWKFSEKNRQYTATVADLGIKLGETPAGTLVPLNDAGYEIQNWTPIRQNETLLFWRATAGGFTFVVTLR